MENMRRQLLGMTIEEMKLFAAELGEKPFRGGQIFTWLHRGVTDFEEMTNLSKALREKLKAGLEAGISPLEAAGWPMFRRTERMEPASFCSRWKRRILLKVFS